MKNWILMNCGHFSGLSLFKSVWAWFLPNLLHSAVQLKSDFPIHTIIPVFIRIFGCNKLSKILSAPLFFLGHEICFNVSWFFCICKAPGYVWPTVFPLYGLFTLCQVVVWEKKLCKLFSPAKWVRENPWVWVSVSNLCCLSWSIKLAIVSKKHTISLSCKAQSNLHIQFATFKLFPGRL